MGRKFLDESTHPSRSWQTGVEGDKYTVLYIRKPVGSFSPAPSPPSKTLGLVSIPLGHLWQESPISTRKGALVTFSRLSTNHLNIFLLSQFLPLFLFCLHILPSRDVPFSSSLSPTCTLDLATPSMVCGATAAAPLSLSKVQIHRLCPIPTESHPLGT